MTTLSYNLNDRNGCCLVYSEDTIHDIALFKLSGHESEQSVVRRATESISSLQLKYKSQSYIFRYPPILKSSKQENLISDMCEVTENDDFNRTPFSINGCLAGMYNNGEVKPPAFESKDGDLTLYTDASVVDSRDPSISACILNESKEIVLLVNCSVKNVRNVAEAESYAGLLGTELANSIAGDNDVTWYCDNNIVLRFVDGTKEQKLNGSSVSVDLRDSVQNSHIHTKKISGSDNTLADSMAKDIRHSEVGDRLIFLSPSCEGTINRESVNRKITKIRSYT